MDPENARRYLERKFSADLDVTELAKVCEVVDGGRCFSPGNPSSRAPALTI